MKLVLTKEDAVSPVLYEGLAGLPGAPVVIRGAVGGFSVPDPYEDFSGPGSGAALFTGQGDIDTQRVRLNREAARLEASGQFPGVYNMAREAALTLLYCRHVVLEDLHFENCWPTAVLIENCENVTIRNCSFRGGTFAIAARGRLTRNLLIENCFWEQDRRLWKEIDWKKVHGDDMANRRATVEPESDWRGLDGDFFRSWGVAGQVVIRHNLIRDAFNAIHCLHHEDGIEGQGLRNLLVENNFFLRIRDNTIEPEEASRNWVVRHNVFAENYRPFAFEDTGTGYFYIYGNVGWNFERPGPALDENTGVSLFKFGAETESDGPTYFFHNSWATSRDFAKKRGLRRLHSFNNAIQFIKQDKTLFGALPQAVAGSDDPEESRFTMRWGELDIRMDGDMIAHPLFPYGYRSMGYPIGERSSGASPSFVIEPKAAKKNDKTGSFELRSEDFKLARKSEARGRAIEWVVEMPIGSTAILPGGANVGAWQGDSLYEPKLDFAFLWTPTPATGA